MHPVSTNNSGSCLSVFIQSGLVIPRCQYVLRGLVERFGDHSLVLHQFCVSNQFPGVLMNLAFWRVILQNQGSGGDKENSCGLRVSICCVCVSHLKDFIVVSHARGSTPVIPQELEVRASRVQSCSWWPSEFLVAGNPGDPNSNKTTAAKQNLYQRCDCSCQDVETRDSQPKAAVINLEF